MRAKLAAAKRRLAEVRAPRASPRGLGRARSKNVKHLGGKAEVTLCLEVYCRELGASKENSSKNNICVSTRVFDRGLSRGCISSSFYVAVLLLLLVILVKYYCGTIIGLIPLLL